MTSDQCRWYWTWGCSPDHQPRLGQDPLDVNRNACDRQGQTGTLRFILDGATGQQNGGGQLLDCHRTAIAGQDADYIGPQVGDRRIPFPPLLRRRS
jgi:hypothetical protein